MIEVYCDESRPELLYKKKETTARYMVIGGVWISYLFREDLKANIKKLKERYNYKNEIKWKNVSPSMIDFYLELIDLFFKFDAIRFRCIVVDCEKVDLDKFHDSDSELGFYKFYYQLLKHWIDEREKYWIYLDYKKNKLPDRLHQLESVLEKTVPGKVQEIQAINSRDSLMIQLADVLIGAVGYKFHNCNTSKAKLKIIERLETYIEDEIQSTFKSERKFNVFKINLNLRG
ncbi:DUF3800 domain-containing protein [Paenibacillus sp. GCM10012307]|uniref:DUF3800 domain-containing protein n=1 Tax=Paenibacillus roseus TaxID=2798579 RepID=A0A934J875_9BACL|nr:DUF3800 domain-containing protein [Paenibacillus roseus]MBJ6362165.1 DUF3800 domain-containing protein [Paenibacillus roseus]